MTPQEAYNHLVKTLDAAKPVKSQSISSALSVIQAYISSLCPHCHGKTLIRVWVAQDELGAPEKCCYCRGKGILRRWIPLHELQPGQRFKLVEDGDTLIWTDDGIAVHLSDGTTYYPTNASKLVYVGDYR